MRLLGVFFFFYHIQQTISMAWRQSHGLVHGHAEDTGEKRKLDLSIILATIQSLEDKLYGLRTAFQWDTRNCNLMDFRESLVPKILPLSLQGIEQGTMCLPHWLSTQECIFHHMLSPTNTWTRSTAFMTGIRPHGQQTQLHVAIMQLKITA